MIAIILIAILAAITQVAWGNLLSIGYSIIIPLLLVVTLTAYFGQHRHATVAAVVGGLTLDLWSAQRFGHFLFIFLLFTYCLTPLFFTTDRPVKVMRAYLAVFILSIVYEYLMLYQYHLALPQLLWPLLGTGILNMIAFYLLHFFVKRFIDE